MAIGESVRGRLSVEELALFDAAYLTGLEQGAFVGAGYVEWCISKEGLPESQWRWFPNRPVTQSASDAEGLVAWYVEDARLLPVPIPSLGKLNLWKPKAEDRSAAMSALGELPDPRAGP
jgi:hypothetical protein